MNRLLKVKYRSSYSGNWETPSMRESWEPNIVTRVGGATNVYDWIDRIIKNTEMAITVYTTPYVEVNGEQVWSEDSGYTEEWQKQRLIFELSRK